MAFQLTQDIHTSNTLSHTASQIWSGVKTGFGTFIRQTQVSRMASAMRSMSDVQLADIGITRSEILSYSQNLINNER